MTEHENQNVCESDNKLACLYKPAVASAVIAAAVGLIAMGVMLANYAALRAVDPFNAPALESMKQTLADHGEDENLRLRVRELDVQIRQAYFTHQSRMAWGRFVLGGAAAALLAAMALAGAAKPSPWLPPKAGAESSARPTRDARQAKAGVLIAAAALVGTLVMSAAWKQMPAPQPSSSDSPLTQSGGDGGVVNSNPAGTHVGAAGNDANTVGANTVAANGVSDAAVETKPNTVPPPATAKPVLTGRWPMFRGPDAQGIGTATNVPLTWDGPAKKNIAWKTELPLPGPSSPIAWDGLVFVSGASDDGKTLGLACIDGADGRVIWDKQFPRQGTPPEDASVHHEAGYAAATPATDGKLVFALYASGQLVAYDFAGLPVWDKTFPWPHNRYGHATSLVVLNDLLLVLIDQEPPYPGVLYALDCATGEERWRADRTTVDSWTVPLLTRVNGRDVIVTVSKPDIIVYDADGKVVWQTPWVNRGVDSIEPAASPAVAGGMLVAATAWARCIAVPIDSVGDASKKIEWEISRDLPDICSLLAVGDNVLMMSDQGVLSCFSARECDEFYTHQFPGSYRASPVLADGNVYLIDEAGVCNVISPGTTFENLATNPLGEPVNATPAIIDGRLFIRGQTHLFCVAEEAATSH